VRQFRRFFTALFVVATLIGALHEIIHDHHHEIGNDVEESCPIYLLTHTSVVLVDNIGLQSISVSYEPIILPLSIEIASSIIHTKSRSPPHA